MLAIEEVADIRKQKRDYISEEEYVEENLNADYAQGLVSNVLKNFQGIEVKKQRRRLQKNRLKEIPNFEIADIVGDFDIDEEGNNLIVRGKDGKLNDREGRRVN